MQLKCYSLFCQNQKILTNKFTTNECKKRMRIVGTPILIDEFKFIPGVYIYLLTHLHSGKLKTLLY